MSISTDVNVFFTYYASLVKNLRGVILLDPSDADVHKLVEWLRKRFHYRNLGIIPSCIGRGLEDLLSEKVFRALYYPMNIYKDFVNLLEGLGLDRIFIETSVLSSLYISPLFLLSSKYIPMVEKYSIAVINVCRDLDIDEWKLHMRIADYSILDSYEEMVNLSMQYIENIDRDDMRKNILKVRREFVEKDVKRYWRIRCEKGVGLLYYLDLLTVIEENLQNIKHKLNRDYAAALAIIPTLNITLVQKQL